MAIYTPYVQPSAVQLLTIASFLYVLNVAHYIFDKLLYAGLLGDIGVGIIYGTPLGGILEEGWEETLSLLGYVGLVLIVFEGGLSIQPSLFLSNIPLSTICAFTGIVAPTGLSFLLLHVAFGYRLLSSFASGAALSSTSLGTTFFVLQSASAAALAESGHASVVRDLSRTRVGTVLVTAALMDDVVGLNLLSVVSSLGSMDESAGIGWTIGRPVLSSILLTVFVPTLGVWVFGLGYRRLQPRSLAISANREQQVTLFVLIALLSGLVAAAYFAGSSMLLGAFLAGWVLQSTSSETGNNSFHSAYDSTLRPLQQHLFAPLFFASIGFAIPFLEMWNGRIIWRGVTYAMLMAFGKLIASVWLLVWHSASRHLVSARPPLSRPSGNAAVEPQEPIENFGDPQGPIEMSVRPAETEVDENAAEHHTLKPDHGAMAPAALLGLALVARGEIGILIAQVAHSSGADVLPDEPFLLAIWAILLCTVAGPLAVGWVARRYGHLVYAGNWG